MNHRITLRPDGQGLHEFTNRITDLVVESDARDGLCTIFIQHTSASLLIQENADPSARHDLERWLNRLVPEGDTLYTHTSEGPDDKLRSPRRHCRSRSSTADSHLAHGRASTSGSIAASLMSGRSSCILRETPQPADRVSPRHAKRPCFACDLHALPMNILAAMVP